MKSGMKSHPSSEEVLDGLGDKMVTGLSRAVVLAARDLRQYRLTFPQWVSQSSERVLANWIHDRIWWHVTVAFDSMLGVEVSDREPTREVAVGLNYRLRLKRHHEDGDVSTYPTPLLSTFTSRECKTRFPAWKRSGWRPVTSGTKRLGRWARLSSHCATAGRTFFVTLPVVDDGLGGVTVPTVPGPTLPTIQGPVTESKQVKDQE